MADGLNLRINISGIDEVSAAMQAAIDEGVVNGTEELSMRAVQILVPLTPVNFGILSGAMQWKLESGPPQVRAQIFAGPPADVYAAPVEFGTKPHFPPITALLPWVKHKLGIVDEKEAKSVAFAIAQSIAKRGTKGAFMFQKAFDQVSGEAVAIFEKNLAAAFVKHGIGGQA